MTAPLMPKATAVWLVENTTLTFRQIAAFCELHELEVQAIADGDVAFNIIGISPVGNGQLSAEEIKRCEADASANLTANPLERNVKESNAKNKKILSPSQRSDKPAAILWIIRNCPEVADSQICKLIGTTKPTILAIRNGTRPEMSSLRAKNPVAIGLCSEKDLDKAITTAKERLEKPLKPKKTAKKAAKKPAKKAAAKKAKVANKTKKAPAKKTAVKEKAETAKKTKTAKKAAKTKAAKKTAVKKAATVKKPAAKKTAAKKKPAAKKSATEKKTPAKKTKKTTAGQ